MPYGACLFKSSGKMRPWTASWESSWFKGVDIPDTPRYTWEVQELMKFRKFPDTILIALFEANYSVPSHFEHLVRCNSVVWGKGTELYELLVWLVFAFFYNLFSKPNHCSMNNVLVSMNFWIPTPSPFLSCPWSITRIFV